MRLPKVKRKSKPLESARPMFVLAVLLTIAIPFAMVIERAYVESLPFAEIALKTFDPIHAQQLDLFVQQSNLLTTLASALLGALGALLLKSGPLPMRSGERVLLVFSVLLCGASLYFGYLAYQEVIWMLHSGFFNLEEPHVGWARRLQFFTFLTSTLCSLLFVGAWVGRPFDQARDSEIS